MFIAIIISPGKFISAGLNGFSAWTFNVLPSVLPFMIISSLLLSTGYIKKICKPFARPFKKLFNTGSYSAYTFFVSIISGYPVGSKIIAELYEEKKISKSDAVRMSSFCSNSGPMFIVGAVGVSMLLSATAGYVILLSHILGAVFNGFLYRNYKIKEEPRILIQVPQKSHSFADIIENSCKSILLVGTIISFFFIIIEFLSIPLAFLSPQVQSVIFGIVEITKGCSMISANFSIKTATVLSSIIITFGGLSTIIQSTSLLKRVNMPIRLFALQKFSQAIFSGVISLALVNVLL